MTALKEEKQDMLIKYHATASKLHEQERYCSELTESMEGVQSQLVKLQVSRDKECSREVGAGVGLGWRGGGGGVPDSILARFFRVVVSPGPVIMLCRNGGSCYSLSEMGG